MKLSSDKLVIYSLVVEAFLLVGYLLYNYTNENGASSGEVTEGFYDEASADEVQLAPDDDAVDPAEQLGENEQPGGLDQEGGEYHSELPAECGYKDVLSSADLLPADANSKWAQVNPAGQGSLQDKNYVNAGFHLGIDTVGTSLRNANRSIRSDPHIPRQNVGPWQNSTIGEDVNRRPFEIGN